MAPSVTVDGVERQRIVVEVEPGEPISGSVSGETPEPEVPFVGVMGLVAAIDAVRARSLPVLAVAVDSRVDRS